MDSKGHLGELVRIDLDVRRDCHRGRRKLSTNSVRVMRKLGIVLSPRAIRVSKTPNRIGN